MTLDPNARHGAEACQRVMVGCGTDVYDPCCGLPSGHVGICKSPLAVDTRHKLNLDPDADWRDPFALLRRVLGYYPEPPSRGLMADVEMCLAEHGQVPS